MNPDVATVQINAIQTTVITTTDSHIVCFSIVTAVNDKVGHRRVDQYQVMNGPIRHPEMYSIRGLVYVLCRW